MQRIFFVGVHNKPNLLPLDSSTVSGKRVDAIIKQVDGYCFKTNLCDVNYWPKDFAEIMAFNIQWCKKYQPTGEDIVVLLGKWVQKHFVLTNAKIIKIPHPASCYGKKAVDNYVQSSIKTIAECQPN